MGRKKNYSKLLKIKKLVNTKVGKSKTPVTILRIYYVDPNKESFKKLKEGVDYFLVDKPKYDHRNIRKKLSSNKDYALENFLMLYEFQTDMEKELWKTILKNNVGFNKPDGAFASQSIEHIRRMGGLAGQKKQNAREFDLWREKLTMVMPKYARQIADILNGNNSRRQFVLPEDVFVKKTKQLHNKSKTVKEFAKGGVKTKKGKPSRRIKLVTADGIKNSINRSSEYALQMIHLLDTIVNNKDLLDRYGAYLGRRTLVDAWNTIDAPTWMVYKSVTSEGKLSNQEKKWVKRTASYLATELAGILNVNKLFNPHEANLESKIQRVVKEKPNKESRSEAKKEQQNEKTASTKSVEPQVRREPVHDVEFKTDVEIDDHGGKFQEGDEFFKDPTKYGILQSMELLTKEWEGWNVTQIIKGNQKHDRHVMMALKSQIKQAVDGSKISTSHKELYTAMKNLHTLNSKSIEINKKALNPFNGIDWSKKIDDYSPLIHYSVALSKSPLINYTDNPQIFGNMEAKEFAKLVDNNLDRYKPDNFFIKSAYLLTNTSFGESVRDLNYYKKFDKMLEDLNFPKASELYDKVLEDKHFYWSTQTDGVGKQLEQYHEAPYGLKYHYLATELSKNTQLMVLDHQVRHNQDELVNSKLIKMFKDYVLKDVEDIVQESPNPKKQEEFGDKIGMDVVLGPYYDKISDLVLSKWVGTSMKGSSTLLRRSAKSILGLGGVDEGDYVYSSIFRYNLPMLDRDKLPKQQIEGIEQIYKATQEHLKQHYPSGKLDILYRGNSFINTRDRSQSITGPKWLMGGVVSTSFSWWVAERFTNAKAKDIDDVHKVIGEYEKSGNTIKLHHNYKDILSKIAIKGNSYLYTLENVPNERIFALPGEPDIYIDKDLQTGTSMNEKEVIVIV